MQRYWNSISVRRKIGVVFLMLFMVSLINGAMLYYNNSLAENDSRVINYAGRQRMLFQKMQIHIYEIIYSENDSMTNEYIVELASTRSLFEQTQTGLRFGNTSMDLPRATSNDVIKQWKIVDNLWQEFRKLLISAENNASLTISDIQNEDIETLAVEINKLVEVFEKKAKERNLFTIRIIGISLFFISIVIFLVLVYLDKSISKPLQSLSRDIITINGTDTPEGMSDELDILVKHFSIMQNKLELIKEQTSQAKGISIEESKDIDDQDEGDTDLDEIPVLFAIMNQNGIAIYSQSFMDLPQGGKLISIVVTGLNQFMREIFSDHGNIERIKYHQYTIIMKQKNNLLFLYVYRGSTEFPIENLQNLITSLYSQTDLWQSINSDFVKLLPEQQQLLEEEVKNFYS